ncbi:putative membrane protein [Pectobacterium atrosepticum SCRI1043]|uniref:Membrane protein n=1 Tax=Pectobacterium atrosepticum (strain SCRI 1043 / ATCC BAA-672) TaxID=218491 RepID=Q6D0G4_PECAS|nr:AzlD domain-containing protein [Pectobacterium atrosepticum]KFX14421.1 branched-chain amino acid transporter [Pectobacterium atrosepticum]MCL6317692.1 AzlD domain-containing protein [Pectobacterium atrosepticum]MCL6322415.1 AzlD domain-containing protein [Pectobacterium atrosepticum]MDK9443885.1 AzlD domain-containing protein [Pectobacterium atrosepticum]QXE14779.1 AzlD domain-containing protein [Pectobacterium atrosepticum]
MSWLLIFVLSGIVFFNRYIFLEPAVPVKIPVLLHRALKYSAPCLLTAICGPIILMEHGVIRAFPDNPYFLGAIVSVVISFFIRNIVVAVLLSMLAFYLIAALL